MCLIYLFQLQKLFIVPELELYVKLNMHLPQTWLLYTAWNVRDIDTSCTSPLHLMSYPEHKRNELMILIPGLSLKSKI